MSTFNIHYAIITPESAEYGEVDEVGVPSGILTLARVLANAERAGV